MKINQEKIKELHSYLSKSQPSKNFGLRDGYIFSGFSLSIFFELFVDYKKISLKYPVPNIAPEKTQQLDSFIKKLNPNFEIKPYNTTPKNTYYAWDLNVEDLSYDEIGNLIVSLEKILV